MVGTNGRGGLRERERVVGTEGGGGRGAWLHCCLSSCHSRCVGSLSCPPAVSMLCPPCMSSLCPSSVFSLFGHCVLLLFCRHVLLLHVAVRHHKHHYLTLSDCGVV